MAEFIIAIIFLVPAMLGTAEILHMIKSYIIHPHKMPARYLLVYLRDGFSQEQLISTIEEMKWQGRKYAENIIAVDFDLSDESHKECRDISNANGIIFCRVDNLCETLNSL